jgi:hypothetical protein
MMGNMKKSARQQNIYIMAIMGRHFLVIQSSSFFLGVSGGFSFFLPNIGGSCCLVYLVEKSGFYGLNAMPLPVPAGNVDGLEYLVPNPVEEFQGYAVTKGVVV